MTQKKLMSQALQFFNRTPSPNLLTELSEETSQIQELSEEVMSQVWGGIEPPDTYMTPCPGHPYIIPRQ